MSPRHPYIMAMQWAENYAYGKADKVVSILPNAAEHMIGHGMTWDKFVHIPNGIDVREWEAFNTPLPDEHEALFKRLRSEERFILGYAGAHGVADALKSLMESGALLKDSTEAIVLVGSGPEKQNLQKLAAGQNVDNVFFLPSVPKGGIPRLLSMMDALYIGATDKPDSNPHTSVILHHPEFFSVPQNPYSLLDTKNIPGVITRRFYEQKVF